MQQISTDNFGIRDASNINMVIIHYTEVDIEATFELFQSSEAEVSAHYVIGYDGVVYQFVDECNKAWHAGVSYWQGETALNDNSIGVEIVNNGYEHYNKVQIMSLINLLKEINIRHKINSENVLGHSDVAPIRKNDPGFRFPWQLLSDHGVAYYPKVDVISSKNSTFSKEYVVRALSRLGYKVDCNLTMDEIGVIIYKFCLRYAQENITNIWNEYVDMIAKRIFVDNSL